MTTIVNLTRAELRKLVLARSYLIALVASAGLAVTVVITLALAAGKNGAPALATTAGADSLLKVGFIAFVAMLVLGILAAGGEYRYKTIIPAMLITPRRGTLVAAKVIAVAIGGVVLSSVTFGVGLATAVAELSSHGIGSLPSATVSMLAGTVIAGILAGVIGVALGYITRSTVAAVVGAVGWLLIGERVLGIAAPQLGKWLIYGTARVLTDPPGADHGLLTPGTAAAVVGGYTAVLLATAAWLVRRRDVA